MNALAGIIYRDERTDEEIAEHMMPGKDKNEKMEFERENTEFNF